MKKIIIYRSFDGEDFYTEEDCREYEVDALKLAREFVSKVLFFNEGRKNTQPPTSDNVDEYIDFVEREYDDSFYMEITDKLSVDAENFMDGYLGLYLPDCVGSYKYDFITHEWKAAE